MFEGVEFGGGMMMDCVIVPVGKVWLGLLRGLVVGVVGSWWVCWMWVVSWGVGEEVVGGGGLTLLLGEGLVSVIAASSPEGVIGVSASGGVGCLGGWRSFG